MRPIYEVLIDSTAILLPVAKEEAARQAKLIIAKALGTKTLRPLYDADFPDELEADLENMLNRRLSGEPLQYILGEWDFMGLTFFVGSEALIPRQDTETLCEAVLKRRPNGYGLKLLDLCCGTGCIGLSLAKLGGYSPTLAEISPSCINLAKRNADLLEVDACFAQGDLFGALEAGESFDIICCNPPYITHEALCGLQAEVLLEPRLALDGGPDGLDFYRRIAAEYPAWLKNGGLLALEIGFDQAAATIALFPGGEIIKDICGQDRVILLEG